MSPPEKRIEDEKVTSVILCFLSWRRGEKTVPGVYLTVFVGDSGNTLQTNVSAYGRKGLAFEGLSRTNCSNVHKSERC